ncbi:class I SAM-dependent methyltransferase [Patescibacteria group bacterium]|nr:class I SAM-dependent methyltransferase [Alphaproteobacteria bacterium]MBU1755019.1 class I SAM-dependent methyltransferase [Patescibacteria group bacterium]
MSEGPQVDSRHYNFNSYSFEDRFVSYYWQLKTVIGTKPSAVLEVGVGDKVFGSFITNNTAINYTSIDIAEDLNPDVLGSVTSIPLESNSYDVVCAFEVLEHLPYDQFELAIAEMVRVARKNVVISLPHFGPNVSFSLKFPLFPLLRFSHKLSIPKEHVWNGQHYWELGKKGFPVKRVRNAMEKYGKIKTDFVPFNSQYHHFFVLEVAS